MSYGDIIRYRGDTRRIRRTVKSGGSPVNITGWLFLLTVSSEKSPADTTSQVAQIAGVIADAAGGVVDFTPAAGDVDTAGAYYYDIQATDDSGSVTTLVKGTLTLLQDITK